VDLCWTGPAANLRYVTNSATSGFCRVPAPARECAIRTRGAKLLALVRALLQSTAVCLPRGERRVAPRACTRTSKSYATAATLLRNTSLAFEEVRPRAFFRFCNSIESGDRKRIVRVSAFNSFNLPEIFFLLTIIIFTSFSLLKNIRRTFET